jgi:O-antigen ligase
MTVLTSRTRGSEAVQTAGVAVLAVVLTFAALVFGPMLAVIGLVAIAFVVGIVENPVFGIIAVTGFVILQVPEIATDFHGAPSTFAPLLALVVLSLVARSIRVGTPLSGAARPIAMVAVLLGVGLLSLLTASGLEAGVPALSGLAKDSAIAIVIALLARTSDSVRTVVWVLLGGGMFLAGLSMLQFLTGAYGSVFGGFAQSEVHQIYGTLDDVRVSGPIEDANFYAQWMVMLVPLAIDRFHDETARGLRIAALASMALSVGVVVITFSRGGLLALAVVVGIMALRHPPQATTVAAVFVGGLLLVPVLPNGYVERMLALADIGETAVDSDPSIRAREAEVMAATQMFLDHPVTGIGYGNYLANYQEYVRDLGIEQTIKPREAHNLYLETAAETGIVGVFAFFGIIVGVAASISGGRKRFRSMGDHRTDGIGFAIGVSLIGYLTTSVFLHMSFARPMWLLVGVALALPSIAGSEDARRDELLTAGSR